MEKLKILEFISYGFDYGAGCDCGNSNIYGGGSGSGVEGSSGYSIETGYGEGNGAGYASYDGDRSYGYGRGHGCGDSNIYSDDSGSGAGYYNFGSSLNSINGKKIYIVDGVATIINHIHGNIAKGAIINSNLTETPCYIVKEGRYFAHGKTLAEANTALQSKLFNDMPIKERIVAFWECHKKGVKYPTKDFFEWHYKLTGSCLMGRQQFAKSHGVDLEGEMTVEEFITLTKNAFGGDIIKKLEEN